ncbi:hypothetical protein EMIT0194MI4_20267 [Pseudomonas sp. IT-194MI4]
MVKSAPALHRLAPVLQHAPIQVLALTRDLYCKLSDVFTLETRNIQFIF